MLNELKRLQVSVVLDLEELVAAEVFATQVRDRFTELNIEAPEWLRDKVKTLRRAITTKVDEMRALEAKELEAELQRLRTPQERKQAITARLKELRPLVEQD